MSSDIAGMNAPARASGALALAVANNAVVLGSFAALLGLGTLDFDTWYLLGQEDGPVEWATVLALVAALALALAHARRSGSLLRASCALGLAAFCLFFAGEEVSWGQRLFGYLPPPFFLEHNTQQEMNAHNLFKEVVRTKVLLFGLAGVGGIVLPLLLLLPPLRRVALRLDVVWPPLWLAPSFAAVMALLVAYPLKYSGELAEAGFAFALFGMLHARGPRPRVRSWLAITIGVFVLAALIPSGVGALAARPDEGQVALARAEAAMLARDWRAQEALDDRGPSDCRTHIRIFAWVARHDHEAFREGAFATSHEGDRHTWFLDPWNSPWWVRHVCDDDGERVTLYSFGPDRNRDSTETGLGGDDVGVVIDH